MKEKLWLHAYSGKENGLMVVGTPAALAALGKQLIHLEPEPAPNAQWPPEIAKPETVGPYKDLPDFTLSFHVQGSAQLDKVVPLGRRTLRAPLFIAITICAATGAVVIARWLIAHAL